MAAGRNEGEQRPIQVVHRMRLVKFTEQELVFRTIVADRLEEKQEVSKRKRFEGW